MIATVMNALNSFLTAITDTFFSLWVAGPAWVPLVVVAAFAGVIATIIFRFTSRQDRLRRDAELIQAQLLAMKLFRDDLRTMWVSFGRLLRYTALRLWHSLPPVLVMTVPFVLLLAQLARWYEHAPLMAGDQAVVVFRLSENAWSHANFAKLEPAAGVKIETPTLRDEQERALYWRIRITEPSLEKLRWNVSQQAVEKTIAVADDRNRLMAVDTTRPGPQWTARLLHPAETAFASADPGRGITIQHQQRTTPVLGLTLPWWATFLLVSVLAALLAGRVMKVQF
jgi:hypothetical protein